jgi:hypothetical protein
MQRSFTVLSLALVSSLVLTACPEKKAEKEEPAAAPDMPAAADQSGAEEKKAEEPKKEETKEEPAKEEGGW